MRRRTTSKTILLVRSLLYTCSSIRSAVLPLRESRRLLALLTQLPGRNGNSRLEQKRPARYEGPALHHLMQMRVVVARVTAKTTLKIMTTTTKCSVLATRRRRVMTTLATGRKMTMETMPMRLRSESARAPPLPSLKPAAAAPDSSRTLMLRCCR